jgi:hypothetical protein
MEKRSGGRERFVKRKGSDLTSAATRLQLGRLRYRELLREEVARTVRSPAEVDEEIRSLIAVLGEGGL